MLRVDPPPNWNLIVLECLPQTPRSAIINVRVQAGSSSDSERWSPNPAPISLQAQSRPGKVFQEADVRKKEACVKGTEGPVWKSEQRASVLEAVSPFWRSQLLEKQTSFDCRRIAGSQEKQEFNQLQQLRFHSIYVFMSSSPKQNKTKKILVCSLHKVFKPEPIWCEADGVTRV